MDSFEFEIDDVYNMNATSGVMRAFGGKVLQVVFAKGLRQFF